MPTLSRLLISTVLCLGLALPTLADEGGNAGAYLAARIAASEADYRAAADWYDRALADDPANPVLLEGAVLSHLSLGNMEAAAAAAAHLAEAGRMNQLGYLALVDAAAKSGEFDAILGLTKSGSHAGALLEALVTAWAHLGAGRMSEATASFDALAKTKGLEAFGLYHKALALAAAGDFGGADEILSGRAAGAVNMMRRGVIAHAQILSQLERNADAVALLDQSFGTAPDPQIDDLRHRLQAGEPMEFDVVRDARDGLAEVFFTLSTALNGEAEDAYTLLYTRIASDLRPDHTEALLLTAGLLEQLGQHDLATEAYGAVPPDNPVFHVAEMGRAEAAWNAGRRDAAVEILTALTRSTPGLLQVQAALADTLRRDERFAEARAAYDAALTLIATPAAEHWVIYYSRGICAERLGDFTAAEADMRQALALNPDQPQVLNYLGYSFVDRGINLEEALGMIQRAVAGQPESGFIIDSLAWAYFRLGRYAEAVAPMEKASLLEPVDPIVTDHLGDVYWMVGRTREAEFQWHRALSFGPTETEAARIRAKLEKGLDAVLAEEAGAAKTEDAATNGD